MSLFETIVESYPELVYADFDPDKGTILLQNDCDEAGDYIVKWHYEKPIPKGLKLGK